MNEFIDNITYYSRLYLAEYFAFEIIAENQMVSSEEIIISFLCSCKSDPKNSGCNHSESQLITFIEREGVSTDEYYFRVRCSRLKYFNQYAEVAIVLKRK